MKAEEQLNKKLNRLKRHSERLERAIDKEQAPLEELFRKTLAELESEKNQKIEDLTNEEVRLQGSLDQAGKEFARKKYVLERDAAGNRTEIQRMELDMQEVQKKINQDITHLNEERTRIKISQDRQISALNDLYQEKKRHLLVAQSKFVKEWQVIEEKLKTAKEKYHQQLTEFSDEKQKRVNQLKEQAEAKQLGWLAVLEAMKKETAALGEEKSHLEKRLSAIRGEKEKELEEVRVAMTLAREQLEVDKASLIEKAEDEQRRCEADVQELKKKIEIAEKELQDFVVQNEQKKKDLEETFLKEENMIKESVKIESEKRDYEQKLFEQEKIQKEKEINRMKEEYEKKKWQWDNQVRSLLMQKSVQDSEHEAIRMRVDREARTVLRSMEAKRDELKQRLSDLKSRHKVLVDNSQKETDLINQRWHWRRDRLWNLWQNRLEVLRKERGALNDQIEALHQNFENQKKRVSESDFRDGQRSTELQGYLVQSTEQNKGQQKHREIQFELEKTRIFTQIKECENHIEEWTARLKQTQDEIRKNNSGLVAQMGFLDRWYREEETETQLFLQSLQSALTTLEGLLDHNGLNNANAA